MSKTNPASESTVLKWLKRGDGQGEGSAYNPFLKAHEFGSKGRTRITNGIRCHRQYHYFSDLEYQYHVLAEFASDTIDIREQFALLPRDAVRKLAEGMGIRYPLYPKSKILKVLTSDIVVTARGPNGSRLYVMSVKYIEELNTDTKDKAKRREALRIHRSLAIEKAYWEMQGVKWYLVTDAVMPQKRFGNLDKLRDAVVAPEYRHLDAKVPEFVSNFADVWKKDNNATLNQLLGICAKSLSVTNNEAFAMFAKAVWTGLLSLDLDRVVLDHQLPVRFRH